MKSSTSPQKRLLSAKELEKIDLHLESIYEQGDTKKAGMAMAAAKLKTSQIRGLENLAVSTRRFSEIINFIKNQTGKDKKGQWTQVAEMLLDQLHQLEEKAREIGGETPEKVLEIKRRLARGWVKQMVAHYLYESVKKEQGES